MSRRPDDDASRGPPMLAYRRTYSNYHDVKHLLPTSSVTFIIECVCCHNKHETGDPQLLVPSDREPSMATGPLSVADTPAHNQHMPLVLPCGHIAGWSCLEKEVSGRCPMCGVLWRRGSSAGHCSHAIGINPFRSVTAMTADEIEWLLPPGGHILERCRYCATLDALRELTRLVRTAVPGNGARCVYATDGAVNGFLEGDDLKPFATLEIAVGSPIIPPGILEEAWRREEAIRARYEGRTPVAESKVVGAGRGRVFGFRIAGLARPASEQVGSANGCR